MTRGQKQYLKLKSDPRALRRERVRQMLYQRTERSRTIKKRCRAKARVEAIAAYGGKCHCCGENRLPFLTLGHIDGNGRAHREELGHGSYYHKLRQLGYPPGLRAECWNCNCAAAFNGGVCPHENYRT